MRIGRFTYEKKSVVNELCSDVTTREGLGLRSWRNSIKVRLFVVLSLKELPCDSLQKLHLLNRENGVSNRPTRRSRDSHTISDPRDCLELP
jgi:hypothetical protein